MTVLVYHPALNGGFFYDDKYEVADNPHIRSLSRPWDFFRKQSTIASVEWTDPLYRPVRTLWWATLYSAFGLNARSFHWAGFFLHALNSMLIYFLAAELFGKIGNGASPHFPAFISSAIFLLHTANVEPVSWIAAQGTLLAFCLCLMALLVGLSRKGYIAAVIMGLLYLCASFSYESAGGLPLLYLVILYVRGGARALKEHSKSLMALGLVLALLVVIRETVVGHYKFLPIWSNSIPYHLTVVAYSIMVSLWVTLFPHVTKIEYIPYLWSNVYEPRAMLYSVAGAAVVISLLVALWRRSVWAIPLAGWFFFYLPASNFVPNSIIFGDRLLYMPNIGIAMAAGIMVNKFGKKAALICAIAVLSFGFLSYDKAKLWIRPMQLWTITLKAYPAMVRINGTEADDRIGQMKARPLTMDGVRNIKSGNFKFALSELTEAAKANPADFETRINLGLVLDRLGRPEEAAREYNAAIKLPYPSPEEEFIVHDNLGTTLTSMGKYEEAIAEYRLALFKNPSSSITHSNLATALMESGRYNEAEAELFAALRHNPNSEGAVINLASLYIRTNRNSDAVRLMEIAADRSPDSPIIVKNLAVAYLKAGMKERAKNALLRFLQIYPAARGTPFHDKFLKELEDINR